MTNYERGFASKMAEYGIKPDDMPHPYGDMTIRMPADLRTYGKRSTVMDTKKRPAMDAGMMSVLDSVPIERTDPGLFQKYPFLLKALNNKGLLARNFGFLGPSMTWSTTF